MPGRPRSRWHRRIWLTAAVLAAAGFALGGRADASNATVTATPTEGLRGGDLVVVTVAAADADRHVLVAQCANVGGVPSSQRCGPWTGAMPNPGGGAQVEISVRTGQVGSDPRAQCPAPEGDACVLRVVQASSGDLQALVAGIMGSDEVTDPGPGSTLVQEVNLQIEGPDGATTPTSPTSPSPAAPGPTTPQVGGIDVSRPQPVLPTVPLDGRPQVGGTTTAPGAGAGGDGALPVSGASSTLVLLAIGIALLDLGWLAISATRPAGRLAPASTSG